jgi:hypothetical protein
VPAASCVNVHCAYGKSGVIANTAPKFVEKAVSIIPIYGSIITGSEPGSSVGIATDFGLDGPGIEPLWGRDLSHTSRPDLGPIQPPVQWVPGLSRG